MLNKIFNRIWQFWVRRAARARGFIDPVALMARLNQFGKPSEVSFPIEVVRIGVILQARGVVNSQAIQHNLDWVWPFWVVRQFDPHNTSFIPRAFSMTHINLTHRNWTAVGLPHRDELPIVDPRGLVTPIYDGWSIDGWVVGNDDDLLPSQCEEVHQEWNFEDNLSVITQCKNRSHEMTQEVQMLEIDETAVCEITYMVRSNQEAHCVISLRPFNPEGVSFVNKVQLAKNKRGWKVDDEYTIAFDQEPDNSAMSKYHDGDVYYKCKESDDLDQIGCDVGMCSAAMSFRVSANQQKVIRVRIPLKKNTQVSFNDEQRNEAEVWDKCLDHVTPLKIANEQFQFLYDAAVRTMIIHSAKDVYPGPYTYKHFWFRDAAFMHYAMLCIGLTERCSRLNELFLSRQQITGYFRSQEGEWDSNGQVLWALKNYCDMTGQKPPAHWRNKIDKAVKWIENKRTATDEGHWHDGLMPSGFSAEHLGPNDYYYWDDFWSFAGFNAGVYFMQAFNDEAKATEYADQADSLMSAITDSLAFARGSEINKAMPSSPYRRLDSAAIGSIVAGYPLQIWEPDNERVMQTVEYLLKHCFVDDGFFHDMSHSGINPYLTLYVAQILLRAGDERYYPIMQRVADLASPTGQWPEAVHPRTLGGCMGDGQHAWAAAEWLIMMRYCFIREEKDHLVLCQGVQKDWYTQDKATFGPALTRWGKITVRISQSERGISVKWDAQWYNDAPVIKICLPGFNPVKAAAGESEVFITA